MGFFDIIKSEEKGFDLSNLSEDEKRKFFENYSYYEKRIPVAFVMALFGGLSFAYLGEWKKQVIFLLTIGGLGVWFIINLFQVVGLVRRYNQKLGEEILRELKNPNPNLTPSPSQ